MHLFSNDLFVANKFRSKQKVTQRKTKKKKLILKDAHIWNARDVKGNNN